MTKNQTTVSIIVALLVGGLIGWAVAGNKVPLSPGMSESTSEFQMSMRRLWEDHITWTRLYIISDVNNLSDKSEVAARLMKNQEDIGNAIKPYYGGAAGDQLTSLLKEHIQGAVAVLDAAEANDTAALNKAVEDWYANGDDIAAFLASANPNWPEADLKDMMKKHLDTTLAEAQDILGNKSAASVSDYDMVKDHIYEMSDALSEGIVKQFPDKF